ncbi:ComEC/Rec2 family competence protein [Microcoleus sp. FACHB-831]|uniref:ComEC/Rec2 family competence protein n=1 Tax=Microcoleus sp. FACHB-831 TaxID=2692827 RepID=UPI00168282CD|nr:ComEC/Rec2 family competence protein [Microcoleus sp. FACHB-831]MBD1920038.1 ComEC/Rec2 family competence protein [Microcoleus sp. FACHB-831]
MNPASGAILSLAYILGLVSTAILGLRSTGLQDWERSGIALLGMGVLGVVAATIVPKLWRSGPKPRLWLAAAIVGAIAFVYFQVRMPQLAENDISKFVPQTGERAQEQVVTIQGKVDSIPRLTRNQRAQFWLEAIQLNEIEGSRDKPADVNKKVTGKLYVTVPLLQATGIYPGEAIAVTGILYKPKPVANPGGFDFQAFLAREGGFAGLSGRQITLPNTEISDRWGWWAVRQRIIRSQVRALGVPEGPLLSAMVIGNRSVDMPYDIRDSFVRIGLAHALAASGFQVSLILGVVLALTQRHSARIQFICGVVALLIFVGLTGVQPSVMRAAVMGFGGLIALVMKRKVKPLGSLLVAATILLVLNPLWIWDLGFQLSFLATLGLVVTVSPLTKKLDWLPPAIATLVAVPIAATVWTLPLQIYTFYLVSPYSLLANVISAPLISVISLGGFISALAALILPMAGSALAWLLYYPTHALIILVQYFSQLPGNTVAVGSISLLQMLGLYGLILLTWVHNWWQRRWWFAMLIALSLVAVPSWQTKAALFRVSVLSTMGQPVLVIQDQKQVLLVNSGDADTVDFTVLPFLQQQGVNQIDWGVAIDSQPASKSGWIQILKRLPIRTFYINFGTNSPTAAKNRASEEKNKTPKQDSSVEQDSSNSPKDTFTDTETIIRAVKSHQGILQNLPVKKDLQIGATTLKLISAYPTVLQMQIQDQTWLLMGDLKSADQRQLLSENLPRVQVLQWSGEPLILELLKALEPKVAIASSNSIDPETAQMMRQSNTKIYWTGKDGAIQWTPKGEFETTLETTESDGSLL